jgi:hypothetical protein
MLQLLVISNTVSLLVTWLRGVDIPPSCANLYALGVCHSSQLHRWLGSSAQLGRELSYEFVGIVWTEKLWLTPSRRQIG